LGRRNCNEVESKNEEYTKNMTKKVKEPYKKTFLRKNKKNREIREILEEPLSLFWSF
jgi:hypothetical protein